MLPDFSPRRALLLGLGGGTLANLLAQRWGSQVQMLGVDDDPGVLTVSHALGWHALPGLRVVQSDAFGFLADCAERFDYIAMDLYRGGHFEGRSLTRPVLQRVRVLLELPGGVAINLFRDRYAARRVRRIAQVLRVVRLVEVGDNVVVHARRT
jgi:spermidine synthase